MCPATKPGGPQTQLQILLAGKEQLGRQRVTAVLQVEDGRHRGGEIEHIEGILLARPDIEIVLHGVGPQVALLGGLSQQRQFGGGGRIDAAKEGLHLRRAVAATVVQVLDDPRRLRLGKIAGPEQHAVGRPLLHLQPRIGQQRLAVSPGIGPLTMDLPVAGQVGREVRPHRGGATAVAAVEKIDVHVAVKQVKLGPGIQMLATSELLVQRIAGGEQQRGESEGVKAPPRRVDDIRQCQDEPLPGEFRLQRVLGTLEEGHRVEGIPLAPLEGPLARLEQGPGCGLMGEVAFVQPGLAAIARPLVEVEGAGGGAQPGRAGAVIGRELRGGGGAVHRRLRLLAEVETVAGTPLPQPQVFLPELEIAAPLQWALFERLQIEAVVLGGRQGRREAQRRQPKDATPPSCPAAPRCGAVEAGVSADHPVAAGH